MKKLLSIILSIAMLIAVGAVSVNAFADTVISPQTKPPITVVVEVNGKPSKEVEYDQDKDNDRKITFTYTGDGTFIRWEFPDLKDGDYKIIDGNINSKTITIVVSDDYEGEVKANAIVKDAKNPNPSPKAPGTGALAAAGIAAMGAGAAIIAAARKKRD